MEQHGIGKYTVETLRGQFELQKALLQHLAAAMDTRHRRRAGRALQDYGTVAQRLEGAQVAPRAEAEIQQVKGRWPSYMLEQRRDFGLTSWSRVPSQKLWACCS